MSRSPFQKLVAASVFAASAFVSLVVAADDIAAPLPQTAVAVSANTKWCLRLPLDGPVVYHGVASFDEAGAGAGSFLYPAPNAVGMLAAVFTHALLVDSAKKDQKDKLQAAADKVLLPYKVVLDKFNYRDLLRRALEKTATGGNAKIIEANGEPGQDIVVESGPIFSLTQDQKAIILDNAIVIHMPGTAPEAAYRNTMRVVSNPRDVADPAAFWTANDGEKIKDESAKLVGESLAIAFHDAAASADRDGIPYRTIRYREGTAEKIERAQVLSNHCDRLLIRTLRGTLMSIPTSQSAPLGSVADLCRPVATSPN